jgi:Transposase DDE domain
MLAAHFPLPIKFESRRRHIQRFLKLSVLSIPIIWFPIIKAIIQSKVEPGKRLYLAIDREFHSVTLAAWLKHQQVYFVFRPKKDTNIKFSRKAYQQLNDFGYSPGMKLFLTGIKVTQSQGFRGANIGVYWKRKYRRRVEKEPWYLLTNFSGLEETIKAYKKRSGIEAMFKDCKSGGDNARRLKSFNRKINLLSFIDSDCLYFFNSQGKSY